MSEQISNAEPGESVGPTENSDQEDVTESSDRVWFLKDEPLPNLDDDNFAHSSYADVIESTIVEADPPFTLGVFGSWGVGKSTVINEVVERIRGEDLKQEYVVFLFDVWKYEGDSLRREFLVELQRLLKQAKLIRRDVDVLKNLYQSTSVPVPQTTFRWPGRLIGAIQVLALLFVVSTLIWGLDFFDLQDSDKNLIRAIAAPITVFLFAQLWRNLIVTNEVRFTSPPVFSAEQFEEAFFKLVHRVRRKKIVIIFDNLDRCSHERVVEVLSSIKTFLEPRGDKKCVFVVPCDDEAIKSHVNSAYSFNSETSAGRQTETADEYLRKFFNSSIRINRLLPEEIEIYVSSTMSNLRIFESSETEELNQIVQLVQLVSSQLNDNPRRVKTFFNALTSKYLVALSREKRPDDEKSQPLIFPPISNDLRFLAKVTLLDVKYPGSFREFAADAALFDEAESSAATMIDRSPKVARMFTDEPGLEHFLRGSANIRADNPDAYFNLKQSPESAKIPNFGQFMSSLRTGDVESIVETIDSDDSDAVESILGVISQKIRDWLSSEYYDLSSNALLVWSGIGRSIKYSERFVDRAHGVHSMVAADPKFLTAYAESPGSEAIIPALEFSSNRDRERILGALIDAGLDLGQLETELAQLGLSGYHVGASKITKQGIVATQFEVTLDGHEQQPHRHLHHIVKIIDDSHLGQAVKTRAK
ncbi:MAG: DUF111 family protein, partial [Chloroflexi bacterium]|nr:DUF111 family protein [Chloroflexota bacterium]